MIKGQKNIKCGLIGEKLSHSFSPQIHKKLADYSYTLFEMSEGEVGDFLASDRFDSTNVTIPYKKTVMPFLDEISEEAVRIGSVNTITRTENGKLRGDNTDYFGFSYMINKSGIEIKDKKVLILGTGGASLTAKTVSADMGAECITFVSRTGDINYENVYKICADAEVIINCTPVGMYPKNLISPIDLSKFPKCRGVADMIYNPAKTALLLDAENLGIPCTNGLSMLVAQAKRACELFLGCIIHDSEIDRIEREMTREMSNIVLIGMPGCGKSTIASILCEMTGRDMIDTDHMIVENESISIPEIFERYGEDYFRSCESHAAEDAGKMSEKIIATGGGIVTRLQNYRPLAQNGKIVFIHRDIDLLDRSGRPLSQKNDLYEMYNKRLPLYRSFCDIEVDNNTSPEECADGILKMLEDT